MNKYANVAVALVVACVGFGLVACSKNGSDGAAVSGVAAKSAMGPLEPNMDRSGSDLGNPVAATDPDACAKLCDDDARCQAMTFVGSDQPASGWCWTKGAIPSATPAKNMTSAAKHPAS